MKRSQLNIRSIFESGVKLQFEILSVKKLKKRQNSVWRAEVTMMVSYEINSELHDIKFEKVMCSSLASYNVINKPEKYVGVKCISYNTSEMYNENPFKLVKSDNKYFLYMVTEKGKRFDEVQMPGGNLVTKIVYLYHEPKDYVRFLDCDMLKQRKAQS